MKVKLKEGRLPETQTRSRVFSLLNKQKTIAREFGPVGKAGPVLLALNKQYTFLLLLFSFCTFDAQLIPGSSIRVTGRALQVLI